MGDPVSMSVAAGLSLASMGVAAAGKGEAAKGTATADNFKAEQLDQAATYGELKATQVGGQLTRNLNLTLGNIDAVRAAGRVDPNSPSAVAVHDFVETTGNVQTKTQVDSLEAQSQMDEAGAAYMRKASGDALLGGDLSIAGTLLQGAAGSIGTFGKMSMPQINVPGFNPIAGVSGQ